MMNYPSPPSGVSADITKPSVEYRKDTARVVGALILFFAVYLLILVLALGMVAAAIVAGVLLIITIPNVYTLIIGGAMGAVGIFLLIYLVKFLFSKHKIDRSGMMEITREEEPVFFEFVRKISAETGTRFPKKIYLTTEVNASVFYDSSFLSMFFPVRKNLHVGLGLVNSSNISELKAVIAHEFGHFSQRSMKAGSYVYQVNRVVHDMLYNNAGYSNVISGFARTHGAFYLAAYATGYMIGLVQKLMAYMYNFVNLRNQKLSREMEFHADIISASTSGYQPLIASLRRMEISQTGYDRMIEVCNAAIPLNLKPENIFPLQSQTIKYLSDDYKIEFSQGLPQITATTFARFYQSKVKIKDLWASHPSTDDREKNLQLLNLPPGDIIHDSAWTAFQYPEAIQKKMTTFLFSKITFEKTPLIMNETVYEDQYNNVYKKFRFDDRYHGYYDNREIPYFNVDEEKNTTTDIFPDEIFNAEKTIDLLRINGLKEDIEILRSIAEKNIKTRYFEYENIQYRTRQAPDILQKCEMQLKSLESEIRETDRKLLLYFYEQAGKSQSHETYIALYDNTIRYQDMARQHLEMISEMMNLANLVLASKNADEAKFLANTLIQKDYTCKEKIKLLIADPNVAEAINEDIQKRLEAFIEADAIYYFGDTFLGEKFQNLHMALITFMDATNRIVILQKKKFLDFQAELITR